MTIYLRSTRQLLCTKNKMKSFKIINTEIREKLGGLFLLQILNYDYILGEQIIELPLIETANIKFVRKYRFEKK